MQWLARRIAMPPLYKIGASSGSRPFSSPPCRAGHPKAIFREQLLQVAVLIRDHLTQETVQIERLRFASPDFGFLFLVVLQMLKPCHRLIPFPSIF
jgi:hypothetical protein